MFYPKLKKVPVKSYKLNAFGGIVRKSHVPEACFSDMINLTSDRFPLISVRKPRGCWAGVNFINNEKEYYYLLPFSGNGITAVSKVNGKVCIAGNDYVTVDGMTVDNVQLDKDCDKRTMVPIGRNIFIIPDGIYIKPQDTGFTGIKCDVPYMDFAVERNNRIWGCRFGLNKEGEFVNEIYASQLGDPTNFTVFEGISTDPYTASVGCSGEFTGVSVLGNEVIFFKEDFIIRVSGDTPSDFSVYAFPARGVEKGAHHSVVNLNEQIFYKSRGGIMVYDGTLPELISTALGEIHYTEAVAGGCAGKYYIAMTDEADKRYIYVYDTKTGLWHKEDDNDPTRFMLTLDGCLYFIKEMPSDDSSLNTSKNYSFYINDIEKYSKTVNIFSSTDYFDTFEYIPEKEVLWFAESGQMGENFNPERQYVRSLSFTLSLGIDSYVSIYILPDDASQWKRICYIDRPKDGVFTVPVSIPLCNSFRLRFEGKGEFILFSLTRKSETSSEVRGIG